MNIKTGKSGLLSLNRLSAQILHNSHSIADKKSLTWACWPKTGPITLKILQMLGHFFEAYRKLDI